MTSRLRIWLDRSVAHSVASAEQNSSFAKAADGHATAAVNVKDQTGRATETLAAFARMPNHCKTTLQLWQHKYVEGRTERLDAQAIGDACMLWFAMHAFIMSTLL